MTQLGRTEYMTNPGYDVNSLLFGKGKAAFEKRDRKKGKSCKLKCNHSRKQV